MKLSTIILLFSLPLSSVYSAKNSEKNQNVPSAKEKDSASFITQDSSFAKVKNWNEKIFAFPADYWDNDAKEIIQKLGAREFEKIKMNTDYNVLPVQMSLLQNGRLADTAKLYKKLDQLRMHKIATYTHINSKGVDKGVWAILRVLYSENRNWDSLCKWDTFYFIVPNELVE